MEAAKIKCQFKWSTQNELLPYQEQGTAKNAAFTLQILLSICFPQLMHEMRTSINQDNLTELELTAAKEHYNETSIMALFDHLLQPTAHMAIQNGDMTFDASKLVNSLLAVCAMALNPVVRNPNDAHPEEGKGF